MTLFDRITRVCFILAVAALAATLAAYAFAQTPPPQATPSCESQLEAAQSELIQTRKREAQALFRAASVEEYAQMCKKQVEALTPKKDAPKAAEAPKKP